MGNWGELDGKTEDFGDKGKPTEEVAAAEIVAVTTGGDGEISDRFCFLGEFGLDSSPVETSPLLPPVLIELLLR